MGGFAGLAQASSCAGRLSAEWEWLSATPQSSPGVQQEGGASNPESPTVSLLSYHPHALKEEWTRKQWRKRKVTNTSGTAKYRGSELWTENASHWLTQCHQVHTDPVTWLKFQTKTCLLWWRSEGKREVRSKRIREEGHMTKTKNMTNESSSSLCHLWPQGITSKRNNGLGIRHPHSFSLIHPSFSISFRIKPGPWHDSSMWQKGERVLANLSLCACRTGRPNKPKHPSLEQRKVYCEGQARRTSSSYSEDPNFSMAFRDEFLKATFGVKVAGCMTFFWLVGGEVTGWCFRNLNHQPGSDQSGVYKLGLNMKSPSSTWVGVLVPAEQLKDMCWIVMDIPWGGTRD